MRRKIAYELYDANLSIRENAQKLGCSEAALQKYIKDKGVDRRYDACYVRWRNIREFFDKTPKATLRQASDALGYSPHTISKYKALSEAELKEAIFDTSKVSFFNIKNKNAIKSISYDQNEILAWIMRLHNQGDAFDCDLTASKCGFWTKLPRPKHLFDVYPQLNDVRLLSETDHLDDECFSSVVYDLPYIVAPYTQGRIMERFSYFDSFEDMYKANDEMLARSYRLLQSGGLLVVKTMDTSYTMHQIWMSDYVVQKAVTLGFELTDKFILLAKHRIFSKMHKQRFARKYHSYFFVFRKA